MPQPFEDVPASQERQASRPILLARDEALRSEFSGTAFPTDPTPVAGQRCFRTDLAATFRYSGSAWLRLPSAAEVAFQFGTITALRALDAAAQVETGQRALLLGRSTAGDCAPVYVEWNASSSATADNTNTVFRPSTGAASSGNGRWVLVASAWTQNFTGADATPSVARGHWFVTAGTTPITKFDDATEGQQFTVQRGASDIVLTHDVTKIDLGGANVTLTAGTPRATFIQQGGISRLVALVGGSTVKNSASNSVTRTLQGKLDSYIEFEDFGGVGDGTTDNTNAMGYAMAAALSLGKREIRVRAGNYRFASTIGALRGTRIVGDGIATVMTKDFNDAQLFAMDAGGGQTGGGLIDMAIHQGVGRYGGIAIWLQGDSAYQPDQCRFENLYITQAASTITAPATTLSLSATTGVVTATAGGGTPFAVENITIGKTRVRACSGGVYGTGWGIITGRTSNTVVEVTIYQDFLTTSFASGAWAVTWDPCWDWCVYALGTGRTSPQGIRVGDWRTIQCFNCVSGAALFWNAVQTTLDNFGCYQGNGLPVGGTMYVGGGGASNTNTTQFYCRGLAASYLNITNASCFEFRGGTVGQVQTATTAEHGRGSLQCSAAVSGSVAASVTWDLY